MDDQIPKLRLSALRHCSKTNLLEGGNIMKKFWEENPALKSYL